MATKKKENNSDETESFKIRKSILQKVRDHKGETGTSIQRFIENAIEEKLLLEKEYQRLRKKNKIIGKDG